MPLVSEGAKAHIRSAGQMAPDFSDMARRLEGEMLHLGNLLFCGDAHHYDEA